jgi:UDP-2,3-diacylglucosamine pyrophosphatase LpxH
MAELVAHSQAVIISDLHVGDPENKRLEDFDRDADFERLIDEVIPQTVGGPATLIINGDFIDFPQVLPELAWHRLGVRLGVSEDQSRTKIDRVLRGHPRVFAALRRHLDEHHGQILLLAGNHDVDLHWPSTQAVLRDALGGAAAPDYCFVERGVIHERGLYVEHGNQYTHDNWFERWDHPIVDAPDGPRLERPWGTFFMDLVYNDLETLYPFINKVYPHGRMAWIAMRSFRDDERVSVAALARLVAFFVTHGKRMAAEHLLLGDEPAERPSTREQSIAQLLARLGDGADPRRIDAIAEAALRLVEPDLPAAEATVDVSGLLGRTDKDALARRAHTLLEDGAARVVVFGHTHAAIDGNREPPFGLADPRRSFNTGSWTPSIPLTGRERWSELAGLSWAHKLRYLVVDLGDTQAATLCDLPASPR